MSNVRNMKSKRLALQKKAILEEKSKYLKRKNKNSAKNNSYYRLMALHENAGKIMGHSKNRVYKRSAEHLRNRGIDNGLIGTLENHLDSKYSEQNVGPRAGKRNFLKNTIKKISNTGFSRNGNTTENGMELKGGSKQKIKGRRVLKNGAHAGYVRQKDGSYKWSFIKKH